MNASKLLSSTIVAAALVGGIGFAYAQSSTPDTMSQPAVPADTTTTPATAPTDTTAPAPTELAPQADRN